MSKSRNGVYRVRIKVAPELRDRLPAAYKNKDGKGKVELLKSLRTKDICKAIARSHGVIERLLAIRDAARPIEMRRVWVHNPLRISMSPETSAQGDAIREFVNQRYPNAIVIERGGIGGPQGQGEYVTMPVSEIPVAPEPPMKLAGMTFAALVDHWQTVSEGSPDETRAYRMMFGRLRVTIGHDDANRVTPDDIIQHEEALRKSGLSKTTIANHLKAFKSVFRVAKEKRKIDSNPMIEIRIRAGEGEKRLPFAPAERDRILLAARESNDPVIKWCNLLAGFLGLRLEEIAEMDTRDIYFQNGHLVFHVRRRHRLMSSPNRKLKTKPSVRKLPIHSATVDDFAAFVKSVRTEYGEGPLFPTLRADQDGRLSDPASARINPWLRKTCGIDHPMKSFHSWRHCIASMLDAMPATKGAMANQITGHTAKGEVERYIHKTIVEKQAAIELLPAPWFATPIAAMAAG
jgi:integrase